MADLTLDPYQGTTCEELKICLREEMLTMLGQPSPWKKTSHDARAPLNIQRRLSWRFFRLIRSWTVRPRQKSVLKKASFPVTGT
jgi:hypothetical protein